MKRLHVHSVHKADYAKWMLEDPRVNFSISQRGATPGESTAYGHDSVRVDPVKAEESPC